MVQDDEGGTRAAANATTVDADTEATAVVGGDGEGAVPFELPAAGYQLGSLIGKGGMGEVVAAHDQRIGREVAFKRMRKANAGGDALARFLREARIQARLDHPAIVPVYDLGKDEEGRPYFTMKRLAGKTLAEYLAERDVPRQRLLRAFVDVCLAVELAHQRGVVHRDLKPSNIMLGDFGEVYVLDWGVARVIARKRRQTGGMIADMVADDIDSIGGDATVDGALLGTPGYMAPEQVRGELDVGTPADVYALGSILFEILAGESLHPRGHAALASTLTMMGEEPAKRRPERGIAPELDAACASALQADPKVRPTARALGDRVQQYLDGDRDMERRRVLAREHLANARDALDSGDADRRADAMREAGRALALDPESTEAADLVSALVIEPPKQMPAELVGELAKVEADRARVRGRRAFSGYMTLLLLSAFLPFLHIEHWVPLALVYVCVAALMGVSWMTYRTGKIIPVAVLVGALVTAIAFSRLASPFVLVPVLMCGALLPITNIPWLNDRPWVVYLWTLLVAIVPLALEWTGVLPGTTGLLDGNFTLRSAIFGRAGTIDMAALVAANALFLLSVARFSLAIGRDRRDVLRQVTVQAWHLGKLLPTSPRK
ncbi:MAG: serine/threonine protein kinase [Kofleriaceae bacterium]|nr:serine/threonine protein kinase [Kofleriaceae bacterium]